MSALQTNGCVAVVGAGAMGAGIAQVAAQAGHPVLIYDLREGSAAKARRDILSNLDRLVEKGRMDADRREQVAARCMVATSLKAFSKAVLTIEAIVEDLDAKRALFAELETIVAPEAILASNTSSLSITAVAAGLIHPGRVAGFHFFNPAPLMELVEIVAGLASDSATLATLFDTAAAWGKKPVHARSTPGFIVNRVARPFYGEGLRLLEEGAASATTIDAVIREAGGFRMGPFELMDLIGHDVNLAVTRSIFDAYHQDPRYRPSLTQQELVAAGWLGRKTGRGFYEYANGAAKPLATAVPPGPPPDSMIIEGSLGPAEPLAALIAKAGIPVQRRDGAGLLRLQGASIGVGDGRTATARVAAGEPDDLVLIDLALDYDRAGRVAAAKADQAPDSTYSAVAGLFHALQKTVSRIDDLPGLVVLRTVVMLANEAAEATRLGVASAGDIDHAMIYGVNYPRGPLAWADAIGPAFVLAALDALHAAYGDDRYRPSQALRRHVAAGTRFLPTPTLTAAA